MSGIMPAAAAPNVHLNAPDEEEPMFPAYEPDEAPPEAAEHEPEPEATELAEPEVDWQQRAEQAERTAQSNWARFQQARAQRDSFKEQLGALTSTVEDIQKYVQSQRQAEEALAADAARPDPQEDAPGAFMHDLADRVTSRITEGLGGRLEKIEQTVEAVNTWREEQAAAAKTAAATRFGAAVRDEILAMPPKLQAHVHAWSENRRQEYVAQGVPDDGTAEGATARTGQEILQMAAAAVQQRKSLTEWWMGQFILPEEYLQPGEAPAAEPAPPAAAPTPAAGKPSAAVAQRREAAAKAPESMPRGRPPGAGKDPVAVLAARYPDLTSEQVQIETQKLAKILGVPVREADRLVEERIAEMGSARYRG